MAQGPNKQTTQLCRMSDSMIGGVCAGIASCMGVDVGLVRVVAVVGCALTLGLVGLVYIILWATLPVRGSVAGSQEVCVQAETIKSDVYGSVASSDTGDTTRDTLAHGALVVGLVMVVVALATLLAQSTRIFHPLQFWPLAILAIGVVRMVLPDENGERLWAFSAGLGLIALGLVTLFDSLGLVVVDWMQWLVRGAPMLVFAVIFYALAWKCRFTWAKLASIVLVAIFFILGLAMFVSPGPVQQVSVALPTGSNFWFLL